MEILHQYNNGNVHVTLFNDGTKERSYIGDQKVEFPESLDVKITDYCDAGCAYCHEQSTVRGKHADLGVLMNTLGVLPPGVEIAIGGGNPLAHPNLYQFLEWAKVKQLIPNITVNQKHIKQYSNTLQDLIKRELVYGVGISFNDQRYLSDIESLSNATNNIVYHLIAGVNPIYDVDLLRNFSLDKECKVLILGYKDFGFGKRYLKSHSDVPKKMYEWYVKIGKYFNKSNIVLSFDNLAIDQLNIKRFFAKDTWNTFFMGNDFTHTMYIDAVKQEYAPTSTSVNRARFADMDLLSFFGRRE